MMGFRTPSPLPGLDRLLGTLNEREVIMARNGTGGWNQQDRGGSSPDRSPNDDRSDVNNPNNDAYDADQENQAEQAERGW